MSSYRTALLRKKTPLFLAVIGASTSLWHARIAGHGDQPGAAIRARIGRAEETADQHGSHGDVLGPVKPEVQVEMVVGVSLLAIGKDLGEPAEMVAFGLIQHRVGVADDTRRQQLVGRFVV